MSGGRASPPRTRGWRRHQARARQALPAGAGRGARRRRRVVSPAPRRRRGGRDEDTRSQQATDVVLVVAGGAQSRGAVQHRFHAVERADARSPSTGQPPGAVATGSDRAPSRLWTTADSRRRTAAECRPGSHIGRRAGTRVVTLVSARQPWCERCGSCVRAVRAAIAARRLDGRAGLWTSRSADRRPRLQHRPGDRDGARQQQARALRARPVARRQGMPQLRARHPHRLGDLALGRPQRARPRRRRPGNPPSATAGTARPGCPGT